jgi:lactate permease
MADTSGWQVSCTVANGLKNPFIALLGALSLVQLLIRVDTEAPANILGTTLAAWFRQGFVVISPLLGALGSFFSGSTTVSNLTFGAVQAIAAEQIGVSKTSMLALQAVGASAGNGICLNNIIAACTITGLQVGEGAILGKTYRFVFSLTTIATIVMLAFFVRFG